MKLSHKESIVESIRSAAHIIHLCEEDPDGYYCVSLAYGASYVLSTHTESQQRRLELICAAVDLAILSYEFRVGFYVLAAIQKSKYTNIEDWSKHIIRAKQFRKNLNRDEGKMDAIKFVAIKLRGKANLSSASVRNIQKYFQSRAFLRAKRIFP